MQWVKFSESLVLLWDLFILGGELETKSDLNKNGSRLRITTPYGTLGDVLVLKAAPPTVACSAV